MFMFRLYFVKNIQLQFCFPENENSTRQTRRVADRLSTSIGEWASANFQPCLYHGSMCNALYMYYVSHAVLIAVVSILLNDVKFSLFFCFLFSPN